MILGIYIVRHQSSRADMEPWMFLVGAAVVVVLVAVLLYAVATLRYRITERAVEVIIFSCCVRRIRLEDIDYVRRGSALWNEHWTNFKTWNSVTLRRKSGWVRNFVITPGDPGGFIAELAQKLENLK